MRTWVRELAACREGDVLKNAELETGVPHLWAHIQEGVLASSATLLDDPELLEVAIRSADALLAPAVERAFAGPTSSPYDVGACIYSLDRLHEATGDGRWSRLATRRARVVRRAERRGRARLRSPARPASRTAWTRIGSRRTPAPRRTSRRPRRCSPTRSRWRSGWTTRSTRRPRPRAGRPPAARPDRPAPCVSRSRTSRSRPAARWRTSRRRPGRGRGPAPSGR